MHQKREDPILNNSLKRQREDDSSFISKKTEIPPYPPIKTQTQKDFRSIVLQNGDGKAFWHFKSLTYEINNVRKYMESPVFETANGDKWSILLWPTKCKDYMGLYVQMQVSDSRLLYKKRASVYFETYFTVGKLERKLQQNFTDDFSFAKRDWGFEKYIKLSEYMSLMSKPVIFEVTVSPFKPHEDSKEATGYNGIYNEGTTCYINSLLQTLFFLSSFRKAVYLMPTSEKDSDKTPLALQFIFYHLQFAKSPASTRELLRSFGWTSEQWHVQHDVQEFNCILSDTLEKKMKGTPSEGTYSSMFKGKMINFIHCTQVTYESKRVEHFSDLQLNVQGCKNIYESFDKYVEVEILDGDNKYEAEGFGKQVAEKGVRFEFFPPVLQLQLKRFEYDYQLDKMVKLNQFYEFHECLDLGKYVEGDGEWTYTLFSILVHRGNAQAGHYFSYICPKLNGEWFVFNDDSVDKVLTSQALNGSFGGEIKELEIDENGFVKEIATRNETCAYMLVYIRSDRAAEILGELTMEDIPKSLQEIFEGEQTKKTKEDKAKELKESLTTIYLSSNEIVNGWSFPGISNPESDIYDLPCFSHHTQIRAKLEIKKNAKGHDLQKQILEHHKENIKLWIFTPGFKNWSFSELNLNEPLVKQLNNKAVFVESSQPVFEFKDSWEFIKDGNLSPCSQNTEILDEVLEINHRVLLVFKWYEWNAESPLLTVLKIESVFVSDLESLRHTVYFAKYGMHNDYNRPVHIYIEKAEKGVKDTPNVKAYGDKCNYEVLPYSATEKSNKVMLEAGDCIIGEIQEEYVSEYCDAASYIEKMFKQVVMNLVYYDKFSRFGFSSYSSEIIRDSVKSYVKVPTLLTDSEEAMIESLIKNLSLDVKISPKQVELFTEENSVFVSVNRDGNRTVADLLARYKQLYFDVMPEFEGHLDDCSIVCVLLVDQKFGKIQQFLKVVQKPVSIKALDDLFYTDVLNCLEGCDVKQLKYYLINHPQRCIVRELESSENIDKIVTQAFNLICLRVIGEEENMKEITHGKVFVYVYRKDEESGYSEVCYFDKTATCAEIGKEIVGKFEEKVRVLTCEKKMIGERFEIKPGRVLEDSCEMFFEKYAGERYLGVELPPIANGKNQLKLYRN